MLMFELLLSCELEPVECQCVNYTFEAGRQQTGNHQFILNHVFTLYKPHRTSRVNYVPDKEKMQGPREPSNFRSSRTENVMEKLQQAANLATTKGILMTKRRFSLTLMQAE